MFLIFQKRLKIREIKAQTLPLKLQKTAFRNVYNKNTQQNPRYERNKIRT